MDISKLSKSGEETAVAFDVEHLASDVEAIDIHAETKSPPRPIPEMTAEIIRDMDRLCDWLHKVQKLHLEITRVRQQRMEAEIAARWAQIHTEQDVVL